MTNEEPLGRHRTARATLALGIMAGIAGLVLTPLVKPEQVMLASDVYLHAANAARTGDNFYQVTPPHRPGYRYLYPPVVVFVFYPHALLGTQFASFVLQTILNLLAGAGTAIILWRALRHRGSPIDRIDAGLLVSFVLVSSYGAIHLLNGQTTIWLGFAFAVGFYALDTHRQHLAGMAFAAAALIKVFPAAIGLWLIRQRAWRALAAAIATGVAGILLGLAALGPDVTIAYFNEVLAGRYERHSFSDPPTPDHSIDGIQRQLAAIGVRPPYLTVTAFVILAPLLLVLYRRVDTDARRQATILGTIITVLLFLPLQPLYFPLLLYPLVVLLYQLPSGRSRHVLLAGTLVTFVHVGFEVVEFGLVLLPVPGALHTVILGVTGGVFTFILPPTLGLWLLLLACLIIHTTPDRPSSTSHARPTPDA